ncbi:MAG TPA: FHA domain-containing protein [Blastocatellia bacterium]
MLYFSAMGESDASSLDKAEGIVKRILSRFGGVVDKQISHEPESATLTHGQILDLISRLEAATETSLRADAKGVARVSPNNFKVLLTYEQAARLTADYKQQLGEALAAEIYEFIHNRRYEIAREITVELGADLFAKSTAVKCGFGDEDVSGNPEAGAGHGKQSSGRECCVGIEGPRGTQFRVSLKPGGAPAYIGRGAGSAVRLDDAGVSRLHSSIALRSSGEVVVADLGSANGTYINDRIVSKGEVVRLNPGDRITVSGIHLTIKSIE